MTEEEIRKRVKSLKLNKAADVYGVTAEHIKYADPLIIKILTYIANKAFSSGKQPRQFKIGAIVPTLKKG